MRHFTDATYPKGKRLGSTNLWNDPWLSKAAYVVLIIPLAVLPVRAENDALKRGYAIANEKCAHCHAIAHDDIPPHAIVIPFRQLFTRFPIPMLVEAQERGVIAGHDEMPMFSLTLSDARALLAYIDSLAPNAPGYVRNQKSR